jgi:hypothetical protein
LKTKGLCCEALDAWKNHFTPVENFRTRVL